MKIQIRSHNFCITEETMFKKLFAVAVVLMCITSAFAQESRRFVFREFDGEKRAFIGAGLTSLTPELREFFGAPRESGVLVASLTDNGPSAKAGLRVGDVIIAVDGTHVAGAGDLAQAMRGKKASDTVRLDIVRNKSKQSIAVTTEERDVREFRKTFSLPEMEHALGQVDGAEWRALLATPDTEDLRARIRDLELRLQELEKKLQQK
jgi:membrane-associated protease RseP (regulator of RpoE activity)